MNIAVVGTGYVGLVAGACFASLGIDVLCMDLDERKIARLRSGEVPIYEPGLEEVVAKGMASGKLRFTSSLDEAVAHAQIIFVAVGTPPSEDGSADLTHVLGVARSIGDRIEKPIVVVDKSTVPVGTSAKVKAVIAERLRQRRVSVDFAVVSNPEFLREGVAVKDFMEPDRIVLGGDEDWALERMRRLYAPLDPEQRKIMVMDAASAELTKYAANAMLASRISFMNELSLLSTKLGADIEAVRKGIGSDPRIGPYFLLPGCGYGGELLPKDIRALISMGDGHGVDLGVLKAVETANERQKHVLASMIQDFYRSRGGVKGKTVAVWGIAFKPNTDDVREAPSAVIIADLVRAGAQVRVYDPEAMHNAGPLLAGLAGVHLSASAAETLEGADALAIVTEWGEFRNPDFKMLRSKLRDAAIFDGRNIFDAEEVAAAGIAYHQIGR